jgi:hypothetical protein
VYEFWDRLDCGDMVMSILIWWFCGPDCEMAERLLFLGLSSRLVVLC